MNLSDPGEQTGAEPYMFARDYLAYRRADEMLDRYGIAYIYHHPEVLLGIIPGTSLGERWSRSIRNAGRAPWDPYPTSPPSRQARDADDILLRIIQGYQVLDEIFGGDQPRRSVSDSDERSWNNPRTTGPL